MAPDCEDEQKKFCEDRFHHLDRKLCRILKILQGTTGRGGMVIDMDRLKESHRRQAKILWFVIAGIVGLLFKAVETYLVAAS